ncbi:MAG TPA: quinone-dependent dihydroorotate dehydrogenase [Flavisolibacter sp.]|nr:quinone-dependent dihydroorotate dehydrogenase [Flavisolibacter sp.]
MYRLIRNFLFRFSPEGVHYFSMNFLRIVCYPSFMRKFLSGYIFKVEREPVECFGLRFENRIGLGAGFDKNARYLEELKTLGFGFVEIGTVTPRPQGGNEKPRLFRLPKDKGLINRMGFNNDGVAVISGRLKKWTSRTGSNKLIIGGNIGKNKSTPNDEAYKDYEICLRALHPYVDFFIVNVSSPNTPGLRELQEKDALKKILIHLQQVNKQQDQEKPILLKIAPDLTWSQIDDVIEIAKEIKLSGLVATNTTIERTGLKTGTSVLKNIGAGGLSGKPLKQRSTAIVQYLFDKTGGSIPVIASGGIFSREDVEEKFKAGACLAEVWTGFIYEGPFIVSKLSRKKSTL